jgi:uncharacterized protein
VISDDIIVEVTKRLVQTYNPIAIYLFGSYAWGAPTEESDLDLLVVVEQDNKTLCERIDAGYDALWGLGIPKDILVFTKSEFEQKAAQRTSLCHRIKKEGKLIYGTI